MAMLAAAFPMIAGAAGTTAAAAGTAGTLATFAQTAGTILSAVGGIQSFISGNQQAKSAKAAAKVAADSEVATAIKDANEERKRAALVGSRARAVSAASGGSASDPTVVDILSDIGGEGEYRAMSRMYSGQQRAKDITYQGAADAYGAKQQGMAGLMKGMTTALSGGQSLFEKYGAGGPKAATDVYGPVGRVYQTPFGRKVFG